MSEQRAAGPPRVSPTEPVDRLLRDLRTRRDGLSSREAGRRLVAYGTNEISRRGRSRWHRELAEQLVHPLALLLWAAALLSLINRSPALAVIIAAVVILNAVLAFTQERQAERAVEAIQRYLPLHATVLRDGRRLVVEARELVPGDVLLVEEGDRISADARLLDGAIEVDMSALSGESTPVLRSAGVDEDVRVPLIQARDLAFSGTSCTGGRARAVVFATGARTELGRIASLSERLKREESPLEHQVRRAAWVIAGLAIAAGLAFMPVGVLAAGLSPREALSFAVGLLVANVPEGLLPTITLALAVGARVLARRGAIVKRLSAIETLGSTTVICTDKTGTLTENRMRVTRLWIAGFAADLEADKPVPPGVPGLAALLRAVTACNNADLDPASEAAASGDPTEVALLRLAAAFGNDVRLTEREKRHRMQLHFDPALRLMSTVDEDGGRLWLNTKGAPEAVLARCDGLLSGDGEARAWTEADRSAIRRQVEVHAREGLRVLAVAQRPLSDVPSASNRKAVEAGMTFIGLVAMFDPPRPEVAEAVARCHEAGIRIIMITGDHGLTAAAVARRVGIARAEPTVLTGDLLEQMSESELDRVLRERQEVIFARSSPEAKLRIADALRAQGHVVAMTGDGVNDAPALRRADIGVAMGRSGTDVAREAAVMILTDDNFATIVAAIHEGRRVYDNVRKFILYIFAHATPEVVPFLVFALLGGRVPLPLTVPQILAIDLGTETLPALALGREAGEPGLMKRPPRPRSESIISGPMLIRAWILLGMVSAILVMASFFLVLLHAGWTPGAPVERGSPLYTAYLQATTMTFLGIVACQVGTAFAARTEHVSLRKIGALSNRFLLGGIAFELAFALLLVLVPPLSRLFGTAPPEGWALLVLPAFPFLVWGADELRRFASRGR